ncbi:unnamed protein product [Closterium sp. NIES-54]
MALHPSSIAQHPVLPSPPAYFLLGVPNPVSDLTRAASPTVTCCLATLVSDPTFLSASASALFTELVDFAATCRLDHFASHDSDSDCPPSVGGELVLGCDVFEDRQVELECLVAAVPHLAAMLCAPWGDPNALDIQTPRSYAEVITGQYSSQWGGGGGRGRGGRGGRGGGAANLKNGDNESESRDDRFPGQFFFVSTQAPAAPENDKSFEEPVTKVKVTLHSLDYWVIDSGATYSMTPRADLLIELEPSLVKHVTSDLGQRAEVKGMGKAMFKGADEKMVGLKNVLWVPNLAANLISMRRLQKVGMDTGSKGAKTYTARIGERILWELHENRDVYNEIVYGANDGAKAKESKKCKPGGTSKQRELEESGAAAKEQHKGEENPKAAAEEEYEECMWGTILSAALSNPTSSTGECDWLTLHQRMGHVALPTLQQLVKNEMVAGICVKGEPDEILGCPTCMQAKFTRFPFSSSEATAKAPLDEVVMDVVGPLKLGAAGAEYILTIVDDYTRMAWVYVLSKKSDVAEMVKTNWLPMVGRQQDRQVKAICTDRGGEFLSKDFSLRLKNNGIRHSLTMSYSPAMNGIAERANQTITDTAHGLRIEAVLHNYLWPDAVRIACVAKNRASTHVGSEKWVPYCYVMLSFAFASVCLPSYVHALHAWCVQASVFGVVWIF